MTFLNTNAHDQVAVHLQRESTTIFKYRIELLRKWQSIPIDKGQLALQKIEDDSLYIFKGGNSGCEVRIEIHGFGKKRKLDGSFVRLERDCQDDSLDIAIDEFEKLWYK